MARSFDYIIVGAGSAGCVIAEGLSASHSVLLIEAGGSDRSLDVAIPAAFAKNFKTKRDWRFESEPEASAAGRRLFLPRGKVLGGSSSINAMIYIRGRRSDYDRWESLGATGWGWDSVFPVFRAMESNQRFENEFHGSGGPVRVEDLRSPNSYTRRFIEAALEAGLPANGDFNGETQEGVGYFQVTQHRGRRWSAANAFLHAAITRPTLAVSTDSHCLRVIVEAERAIGVEYTTDAGVERAYADSEVIVAAGAFGSPQILQLSGIGDPAHLAGIGVKTVVESRHVGLHMKDHAIIGVIQRSLTGGTLDDAESIRHLLEWLFLRRGPLTSNVAEAGAFVRSNSSLAEPDLEFHFAPVFFDNHGMTPLEGHAYSLGSLLMHPSSEGTVMAASGDHKKAPRIVGNYLNEPADVDALMSSVRKAREVLAASPFDDVRGEEMLPGSHVTSEDDLRGFVHDRFELLYHPVGTCRIGDVANGVVSPDLSVHGMIGLRVADASVMPATISGNTNAASMMIGSRAVDLILGRESGPP